MTPGAIGWGVGVLIVVVAVALIGLRLLLGRSRRRAEADAEQEVATLASWARAHGWQRVPGPPAPAVAQRVTVRRLEPLLTVGGEVDGRPAMISVWRRTTSKLGSPVEFRTVTWVVSSPTRPRLPGAGVLALGRLASGGATVGPPRIVAARSAVFPWGHGRAALWPAAGLPSDAARLAELAAGLDATSGILLVDHASLSIDLPHTPPDEMIRLLQLARATLSPDRA
ncbi:hypothetical protein GCG21_07490 [Pseudactinotalea sp. HY160]|uniref:hypothetical protein n=1 Tax=Pseudactinotalea sp. HY160 TaxID=2654490 RepID=UPI00128E8815|nr:hypothetical protein [Pseudactinotalea sp. HY160]MPV49847.1 hypothetical protein [Pseudactinotalea sp. HY160]